MSGDFTRPKVTPAQLAERYRVGVEKIIFWIKCGALRAFDSRLLANDSGKPRYLIDEADIAIFEKSREAAPPLPLATARRRRRTADTLVKDYIGG